MCVVRRPAPVPCGACAHGESDNCRNCRYTERRIKELDGYPADLWCVEPEYAVTLDPNLTDVGVLMEPDLRRRQGLGAGPPGERVGLVRTGARPSPAPTQSASLPLGLLTALLGTQQGLDIHVLDRIDHGPNHPGRAPRRHRP